MVSKSKIAKIIIEKFKMKCGACNKILWFIDYEKLTNDEDKK